jgi:hypothetical protein
MNSEQNINNYSENDSLESLPSVFEEINDEKLLNFNNEYTFKNKNYTFDNILSNNPLLNDKGKANN